MKYIVLLVLAIIIFSSSLVMAKDTSSLTNDNIKSSILVLSQDELFKSSLPGRELLKIFEERQTELFSEARKIEQQFILEEKKLTEQRLLLSVDNFQILADEFDSKVEKMRELRTEKDKKLQRDFMNWRKKFVQIVLPIIRDVMSEFDALVVLDSKNRWLIYDHKIDVTEKIIRLLNEKFTENPQILYQILSSE